MITSGRAFVRGATVANGGPLDGTLLGAVGTIVVGAMGATGLWLANRLIGKAAVQTALTGGFKLLFEEQRQLIGSLRETISDLTKRLDDTTDKLHEANEERENLRGEMRQLRQIMESASRPAGAQALIEQRPAPVLHADIIELPATK